MAGPSRSHRRLPKASDKQREIIRLGDHVEKTTQTLGWRKILQPLLDECIASATHRKTDGKYYQGKKCILRGNLKDVRREWLAGYTTGLMEFNNMVVSYIQNRDKTLKAVKRAVDETAEADKPTRDQFQVPMVDDEQEDFE